jgi:hypothetical protein
VCFFVTAEAFQADALASVGALSRASAATAAKLTALGDGMAAALALQAQLSESQAALSDGLRAVSDAQAGFEQLQLSALDGQAALLTGQAALAESADAAALTLSSVADATHAANATLRALFTAHEDAAASTLARLHALGEGASQLEAAQQRFGTAQGELLASSRIVVERQAALASTLDAVGTTLQGLAFWQERVARGLGLLLGTSFGLDDIVWTAGAIGASFFTTSLPHTEAARPLLLLCVGASAATERTLIPWMVTSTRAARAVLDVGAALARTGAERPLPSAALADFSAMLERAEVKWVIRKHALLLCAALLVRALWRYTDAAAARRRVAAEAEARMQRMLDETLLAHETRLFAALREELAAASTRPGLEPPPVWLLAQHDFPLPAARPRAALLSPPLQHEQQLLDASSPAAAMPPPELAASRRRGAASTPCVAPQHAGGASGASGAAAEMPTPSPFGDAAAAASLAASRRMGADAASSQPPHGTRLAPVLELAATAHVPSADAHMFDAAAAASPPPVAVVASPAVSQQMAESASLGGDGTGIDAKHGRKRRAAAASAAGADASAPLSKRAATQRTRSGA